MRSIRPVARLSIPSSSSLSSSSRFLLSLLPSTRRLHTSPAPLLTPNAKSASLASKIDLATGFTGKSIISASQFNRASVEEILAFAKQLERYFHRDRGTNLLANRVMHTVFYEPSTRTRLSFETSMLRMGGSVCHLPSTSSSHQKGETLEDTISTLEKYSDVIVLRHTEVGAADRATATANW